MIEATKPKRGRPSSGMLDVRVWLSPRQIAVARTLGGGILAAGVRAAIDAVEKASNDKKEIS